MKIVLATNNSGKVREINELLAPHGIEAVSMAEYPEIGEIIEDGDTFRDNAVIKATTVGRHTGMVSLADDSGLEVDCLNGAPGVHSARFAGDDRNDRANNEKLLELIKGVPAEKRTARFRCVIAISMPDGWIYTAEGTCEGVIAEEPKGDGGFGYDPLFFLPELGKTLAELDLETKNKISHRGKALAGALEILFEVIELESEE